MTETEGGLPCVGDVSEFSVSALCDPSFIQRLLVASKKRLLCTLYVFRDKLCLQWGQNRLSTRTMRLDSNSISLLLWCALFGTKLHVSCDAHASYVTVLRFGGQGEYECLFDD